MRNIRPDKTTINVLVDCMSSTKESKRATLFFGADTLFISAERFFLARGASQIRSKNMTEMVVVEFFTVQELSCNDNGCCGIYYTSRTKL